MGWNPGPSYSETTALTTAPLRPMRCQTTNYPHAVLLISTTKCVIIQPLTAMMHLYHIIESELRLHLMFN